MPRLTVPIIEQRLINRPIIILSHGKNNQDSSSRWKCTECGHEWNTSSGNVLNRKSGCPQCAGNSPLTVNHIEQILVNNNRPIILLEYGENSQDQSSRWKCTECGHEWNATASYIIRGSGCKHCGIIRGANRNKLKIEMVNKKLIDDDRSLILLHYGGSSHDTSSRWKCTKCGHEWNTTAKGILRGSGCSPCAIDRNNYNKRLKKDDIDKRLISANRAITILCYAEDMCDNSSLWKCQNCGNEWNTSANSVLNMGTGCTNCVGYGFSPSKPAHLYLHLFDGFIKVGITNNLKHRYQKLNNQTINGITYTIENTISWYFENGADAASVESMILEGFKDRQYTDLLETSFDGKTELLDASLYAGVIEIMETCKR